MRVAGIDEAGEDLSLKEIPAPIALLLVLDLALGLSFLANFLVGEPSRFLTYQINLAGEANVATWYASTKLFGIAILLALFALPHFRRDNWRAWLLAGLPLLFALLSADEVAQIHEKIGHKSDALLPGGSREETAFAITGIWMFVVGIPFLVALLTALYAIRDYFRESAGSLGLFVCGVLVWMFGALAIETFSNFPERQSLAITIVIFFEELFEMIGATLMLWATFRLARDTRRRAVPA